MIGKTLGHYKITERIGAGGMGMVYKARDLHLDRFVALKILPPEKIADPDRMRRFVQEAKAASALNHPNIVHVYDIDQADGVDYIAMEYVDGKTLAQLIPRKGMQLVEALKYAVQIADALARAHGAGIVHRDLKPSNIMVDEHGLVKVLDFGLAKLAESAPSGGDETTRTVEATTEKGTIVGTTAYMSPEQAAGRKVDARSDIFSFGSVLYEMVTGRRAFEADSKFSTLAAVIEREPASLAGEVPYELERIITRCLKKDPERRFQHMHDLKVELQEFKEDSDSGRLQPAPAAEKRPKSLKLAIGAIAVIAVVSLALTGWYWLRRQRTAEPEADLRTLPLTSYPGQEETPSFSPDGNSVAFQWCRGGAWAPGMPGADCDIYIKQIGEEPPFQLTTDPKVDFSPAWSPDGRFVAFMRSLSFSDSQLLIIPRTGGQERVLVESGVTMATDDAVLPYLAWTPDSKWLVFPWTEPGKSGGGLFLLSVETLEKRRLTDGKDASPAISPDGRSLVFARWSGSRSDPYLLRLGENYEPQGSPQRFVETGQPCTYTVTWTPDGKEVVSCRGFVSSATVWRVESSASAKPRRIPLASEDFGPLAVSRQGNRLAYVLPTWKSSIWRLELRGPNLIPATPSQFIRSTRNEFCPSYSPDGKRIAFMSDRSGHFEIWTCNSDGSNAAKLTSFGEMATAPRWSPDGRSIAFVLDAGGYAGLYVVSANGGAPRRLISQPGGPYPFACWSRDGQSIYFRSRRSGSSAIWKMPAAGGEAVQLTPNGSERDMPQVSPDGKFLYYYKGDRYPEECSVWRMPVEGGGESRVLDSVACGENVAVGERGVYFFSKPDDKRQSEIRFYDLVTGKARKLLRIEQQVSPWISVSPDGRTLLYPQSDQSGSDLMLVENFR